MENNLPIDGKKVFNTYSIFALSFLFHALTVFQGIDVTDLGFHLTNQVSSTRIPIDIDSVIPAIFLTDFIGGMWLSLYGEPSVIWARFGGVLVFALSSAIVFSILSPYFDRKKVFLVVLISSLFITMRFGICIIDYFTFPALLMNIELWIFNKLLRSKARTKAYYLYSFLLGFMVLPIILSRVTLILIFSIPMVIFFYYLLLKKNLSNYKRVSLLATAGLSCSVLLFAFFYWHIGLLANYGSSILAAAVDSANGANPLHNFKALIRSYIRDSIIIAGYTGWLLPGLYLISIIGRRLGDTVAHRLLFLASLIVISLLALLGLSIDFSAFAILKVSFGVVILLSGIFLIICRIEDRNITLLLLAGITTMVITPIGSGSGLLKLFYGMWLILPLSILLTRKMTSNVRSDGILSIIYWLNPILPVMLILSLFFHATNIYRDNQNRFELNTEFSNRSLRGIYSTQDRVKVLDELLFQLQRYTNEGEKILAVSSIPLIHYLTRTRPALGFSWPGICGLDKIKERQRFLEKAKSFPNLFVLSKVSTRDENWPNATIGGEGEENIKIIEYLKNEYINRLKYSLLWENSTFAIYSR